MKKLLVFLFILALSLPAHASQKLVFGYGGHSLSHMSFAVLQVAYGKLGIEIEGKNLPAARALNLSSTGQTDGEVNRIKSVEAEYPRLIRIPTPINYLEGVALSCDKPIDTTEAEAIAQHSIGIKIGNIYAEKFTRGMPRVTRLPSASQVMDILLARRIDLFVIDRVWATMQMDKVGNECLRINEPPLVTIPLYHYLHEQHADLAKKIGPILAEMEKSGESKAIRSSVLHNLIIQGFETTQPFTALAFFSTDH